MPRQAPIDSGIDVGKALEFRWKGMSFDDIGRVMGVTRQSVIQRLHRFRDVVSDPTLPSIFDSQCLNLLKSVHIESVLAMQRKLNDKKSTVNNLAFAGRQLFEQIRLLEGKSTSNISSLTKVIIQAHKLQEQGTDNAPSALESIPGDLSGPLEASTARSRELAPKRKQGRGKRMPESNPSVGEDNAESVGPGEG